MFTERYQWMFRITSVNDSYHLFHGLNISVNSDVIAEDSEGNFYDIFKFHYLKEAQFIEIKSINNFSNKEHRRNFGGLSLDVAFLIFDFSLSENETIEMIGDPFFKPDSNGNTRYTIPLFQAFAEIYNITYNFILTKQYGINKGRGDWNGVVGLLKTKTCEFSFQTIKYRQDRLDVIDLPIALKRIRFMYIFLQPSTFGSYKALASPLEGNLWLALFFTVLFFIFLFKFISRFDKSTDLATWSEIFLLSMGVLAQQGFNDTTKLITSRFVSFSLLFFSYFVSLYYSGAVLTSLLSPSVNTIETQGQLIKSNLKIGVQDAPYAHDLKSQENLYGPHTPATLELFRKILLQKKSFYRPEEGLDKVRKGKFAFLTIDGSVLRLLYKFTDTEICSSYSIDQSPPFYSAIAVTKGSPYKEMLLTKLSWMWEVGLRTRAIQQFISDYPKCHWRQTSMSISFEAVTLAILVQVTGVFLAFVSFVVEIKMCSVPFKK